ncbi:uncharacterized protein LOC127281755 [Leptopilina boulardi]|uniref:uncharacterized protein LOC127281755 n=1 Tax=Leptopilina boulardi TaxID=63433 RepID=UPI0021F50B56|nr:uncharacterized protein LOC127281755 [Leptopilina boulardi]
MSSNEHSSNLRNSTNMLDETKNVVAENSKLNSDSDCRLPSDTDAANSETVTTTTKNALISSQLGPCETYPHKLKVSIIGAGNVGMACAIAILMRRIASEIVLVDKHEKVKAEAEDIRHASIFLGNPLVIGAKDISMIKESGVVIIAVGDPAPGDEPNIEKNLKIFEKIIPGVAKWCPKCVIVVVTQPIDIMSYVAWKLAKFPSNQVLGTGTLIDSVRFQYYLAQKFGLANNSISCMNIGAQGVQSVPVWSSVNVAGMKLRDINPKMGEKNDPEKWYEIGTTVNECGNTLNQQKGSKGPNSWALGFCTAEIVDAILRNTRVVLPVSTHIKSCAHGTDKDIFMSIPCVIGKEGILQTVKQKLSDEEKNALQNCADGIRSTIRECGILKEVQEDIDKEQTEGYGYAGIASAIAILFKLENNMIKFKCRCSRGSLSEHINEIIAKYECPESCSRPIIPSLPAPPSKTTITCPFSLRLPPSHKPLNGICSLKSSSMKIVLCPASSSSSSLSRLKGVFSLKSTCSFNRFKPSSSSTRLASELIIIDVNENLAKAEAEDLAHAGAFIGNPKIIGTKDYSLARDATVCVITAGKRKEKGQNPNDLIEENFEIFKSLIPNVCKYAPNSVLVIVTTPVDILSYAAMKFSGFPPNRVIGLGTFLESCRFQFFIAQELGISINSVQALIIGENSPTCVPVWSAVTVMGVKLKDINKEIGTNQDPEAWNKIHEKVIGTTDQLLEKKGYSNWSVGICVGEIVDAIVRNTCICITVSVFLKGCRHGFEKDIFMSLPCVVGRNGIQSYIRQLYTPEEQELMTKSGRSIYEAQKRIMDKLE